MTVAAQCQSNPMPTGGGWVKKSGVLYIDTSGRFRIEGTRGETARTKMASWVLYDAKTDRTVLVEGFRAGKARVMRILFEESPGWED